MLQMIFKIIKEKYIFILYKIYFLFKIDSIKHLLIVRDQETKIKRIEKTKNPKCFYCGKKIFIGDWEKKNIQHEDFYIDDFYFFITYKNKVFYAHNNCFPNAEKYLNQELKLTRETKRQTHKIKK